MQQDRILKFEDGVLYLKLKESFNIHKMSISCTMARITREDVQVVSADSQGTRMILTAEEMDLLERGRQMVKEWWDSNPLGERCALLECGHVVNWDAYCSERDDYCSAFSKEYPPSTDDSLYCVECDDHRSVHRFNEADFEVVAVQA